MCSLALLSPCNTLRDVLNLAGIFLVLVVSALLFWKLNFRSTYMMSALYVFTCIWIITLCYFLIGNAQTESFAVSEPGKWYMQDAYLKEEPWALSKAIAFNIHYDYTSTYELAALIVWIILLVSQTTSGLLFGIMHLIPNKAGAANPLPPSAPEDS